MRYICPVCRGYVVAKKGDVNQHHFSHVSLQECTPENVARAVAGLWVAQQLRHYISEGIPAFIEWKAGEGEPLKLDLLRGVSLVAQNKMTSIGPSDVLLMDADEKPKVVISLGINGHPKTSLINGWVQNGLAVVLLNPDSLRGGHLSLGHLLAQSQILGATWLLDKNQLSEEVITHPSQIRQIVLRTISQPPYRFYAELESHEHLTHILRVGDKKLWVPPDLWLDAIGGSRHKLGPSLDVIIQELIRDDGSQIALFYITARNSTAVAVRIYPPGQIVRIELPNSAFRLGQTTALDLARQFANNPQG